MIEINEKWAIGADQYQWVLYKSKNINSKGSKRLATPIIKREATYYHPHLKDALYHLSRLSVANSGFESFIELEEKYKQKLQELVESMNLHREGFKELAVNRYGGNNGRG